jgi:adenylate cyclase
MNDTEAVLAWLEQSTGGRVPIVGTCSIGRLSSNSIVVQDERVSRRHALINVQGRGEFWLVDLGSGNGTYLNGRRVVQPTRLRNGDKIEIAALQLLFQQAGETTSPVPSETTESSGEEKTLQQIISTECWLLVADIEDSTQLMHKLADSPHALVTGKWLDGCKKLIEDCGGSINKFLGDGFFAYWRHQPGAEQHVARALELLQEKQAEAAPVFRLVLHLGRVFVGGAGSMGEENLQGKEVHFVFRQEKLAGTLGESCLVSVAAKNALPPGLRFTDAGSHPLDGFTGEHLFYAIERTKIA